MALGPAPSSPEAIVTIKAWGPSVLLCLMQPAERGLIGLSDLDLWCKKADLVFRDAPIADFSAPDATFLSGWPGLRDELTGRLGAGEKIMVHCRAGLGRSGTITAALLITGGLAPETAIQAVRAVRPGAIETEGQVAWLRGLAT